MAKLLISGFEPFLGKANNVSMEVLPFICQKGYSVKTILLPVAFDRSFKALSEAIDEYDPDNVLMLGEAPYAANVTIERFGNNEMGSSRPDNDGKILALQPILPGREKRLTPKFDFHSLKMALKAKGLNIPFSDSAGTYLCNNVYYQTLAQFEAEPKKDCLFIHVNRSATDPKAIGETIQAILECLPWASPLA